MVNIEYQNDLLDEIENYFFYSLENAKTPILAHYTSPEGLISILTNRALWFSKWNLLNDRSEGNHAFKILKEVLGKYESSFCVQVGALCANLEPEIFSDITNGEIDFDCRENDLSFVCCFSTNKDSLPMWNYYTKTDNSIGYNIVFDSRKLIDNIFPRADEFYFIPVICNVLYKEKKQKAAIKRIVDVFYEVWKDADECYKHSILERLVYLIDDIRFLFKHPAFEPEQEVRIVLRVSKHNFQKGIKSNKISVRRKDGYFIPYIPLNCVLSDAIKEIWISPNNDGKGVVDGVNDLLQCLSIKAKVRPSQIPLRY